ncbi:MAG: DUF6557 family protein [Promethearchaeota archaeon]
MIYFTKLKYKQLHYIMKMLFKQLIDTHSWFQIKSRLVELYLDEESILKQYEKVFANLKTFESQRADNNMQLLILYIEDEEYGDSIDERGFVAGDPFVIH